jgi:hypothetical protein
MGRLFLVVAAAAGIAWYASGHADAKRHQQRLAVIASDIAGRRVSIHCQSLAGELIDVSSEDGKVKFNGEGRPGNHADLKRKVCKALVRFPRDLRLPAFRCVDTGAPCTKRIRDDIWAAHVLAHESWHLAGQQAEDVAECNALQTTAFVAAKLGASAKRAQAIAAYTWRTLYPRTPESYRSDDCRNGGKLDLHPYSAAWP